MYKKQSYINFYNNNVFLILIRVQRSYVLSNASVRHTLHANQAIHFLMNFFIYVLCEGKNMKK